MTATPPNTSPVSPFQTPDKKKSLKLQTAHLSPFWTWPLTFWKFWTPLNSHSTPSLWNHCVRSPEERKIELILLLHFAFQMPACAHKEDYKCVKSANKNHFYESLEGGKSPLSVSLVTFGFDPIVAPSFWTTVGSVCKDAQQQLNYGAVEKIPSSENLICMIWLKQLSKGWIPDNILHSMMYAEYIFSLFHFPVEHCWSSWTNDKW